MLKAKKYLQWLGVFLLILILLIITGTALFLNLSPQFGRSASKDQLSLYEKTNHFEDGTFVNEIPSEMDISLKRTFQKMMENAPNRQPNKALEVDIIDSLEIIEFDKNKTRITWFGHSAFLLEIEGMKVLLDPMLSASPSPLPWLGPQRYSTELPIAIEELPYIDLVILSHDHYDHLDYGSIVQLKEKVGVFVTPLGVGNHLASWGVEEDRIHQLDWWESIIINDLTLRCTPARHFSGRGLFDRATTLWSSWVITSDSSNIYFSGDGGYGPHFKAIGEAYGPFDFALMECGQYNVDWQAIHMLPEETVQAAIDLKSDYFMPIHWAGFTLAFHDWDDPVIRATKKAKELNASIVTPRIGEQMYIDRLNLEWESWWESY